jgi:hypothetical protein
MAHACLPREAALFLALDEASHIAGSGAAFPPSQRVAGANGGGESEPLMRATHQEYSGAPGRLSADRR